MRIPSWLSKSASFVLDNSDLIAAGISLVAIFPGIMGAASATISVFSSGPASETATFFGSAFSLFSVVLGTNVAFIVGNIGPMRSFLEKNRELQKQIKGITRNEKMNVEKNLGLFGRLAMNHPTRTVFIYESLNFIFIGGASAGIFLLVGGVTLPTYMVSMAGANGALDILSGMATMTGVFVFTCTILNRLCESYTIIPLSKALEEKNTKSSEKEKNVLEEDIIFSEPSEKEKEQVETLLLLDNKNFRSENDTIIPLSKALEEKNTKSLEKEKNVLGENLRSLKELVKQHLLKYGRLQEKLESFPIANNILPRLSEEQVEALLGNENFLNAILLFPKFFEEGKQKEVLDLISKMTAEEIKNYIVGENDFSEEAIKKLFFRIEKGHLSESEIKIKETNEIPELKKLEKLSKLLKEVVLEEKEKKKYKNKLEKLQKLEKKIKKKEEKEEEEKEKKEEKKEKNEIKIESEEIIIEEKKGKRSIKKLQNKYNQKLDNLENGLNELKNKEQEKKKIEEQKKEVENEKRKIEEEKKKMQDEIKKEKKEIEEEKKKMRNEMEEEKKKIQEQNKKMKEESKKIEEQKREIEEKSKKIEEEKKKMQDEMEKKKKEIEEEKKEVENEKKKIEKENNNIEKITNSFGNN